MLPQVVARETQTVEQRSAVTTVSVRVVDVNDNPPVFDQPYYEATVSETAPAGTPVITITVRSHYTDVIMDTMASQITSLTVVTVYSSADQRKHHSSASLAFVRGIHRWPVNFPHKGPVTRKMFPFDDVIMQHWRLCFHRTEQVVMVTALVFTGDVEPCPVKARAVILMTYRLIFGLTKAEVGW